MLSILLPLFVAHAATSPSAEELTYLQTRDSYVAQLAKNPKNADALNKVAIAKLEGQLRQIIGPARVRGFVKLGKFNSETLISDNPGFGQADGLVFTNDQQEHLFITTPYLLERFVANNFSGLSDAQVLRSEEFYQRIFDWDVSYTIMADVPFRKGNPSVAAHGLLAVTAQDTGPFPPKDLLIFAIQKDRVLIMDQQLPPPHPQIPACVTKLNSLLGKSPTPEKEQRAYGAYQKCWRENAKKQSFFTGLQDRVDEIPARVD